MLNIFDTHSPYPVGLGFGPDKLAMSILLHHGVYSWLLGVERDEEAANREEYMLPLAEEAVILLILLVTELPLPPWDHDTRVAAVARREVRLPFLIFMYVCMDVCL